MLNEAQGTAFDLFADLDITSAADGNRVEEVNQIEAKSVENYMKNVHDIKIKMQELVASRNVAGLATPVTSVNPQSLQYILDSRAQPKPLKPGNWEVSNFQKPGTEIKILTNQ